MAFPCSTSIVVYDSPLSIQQKALFAKTMRIRRILFRRETYVYALFDLTRNSTARRFAGTIGLVGNFWSTYLIPLNYFSFLLFTLFSFASFLYFLQLDRASSWFFCCIITNAPFIIMKLCLGQRKAQIEKQCQWVFQQNQNTHPYANAVLKNRMSLPRHASKLLYLFYILLY